MEVALLKHEREDDFVIRIKPKQFVIALAMLVVGVGIGCFIGTSISSPTAVVKVKEVSASLEIADNIIETNFSSCVINESFTAVYGTYQYAQQTYQPYQTFPPQNYSYYDDPNHSYPRINIARFNSTRKFYPANVFTVQDQQLNHFPLNYSCVKKTISDYLQSGYEMRVFRGAYAGSKNIPSSQDPQTNYSPLMTSISQNYWANPTTMQPHGTDITHISYIPDISYFCEKIQFTNFSYDEVNGCWNDNPLCKGNSTYSEFGCVNVKCVKNKTVMVQGTPPSLKTNAAGSTNTVSYLPWASFVKVVRN